MKHHFIFREAADDSESHVFLQSVLKALFSITIQSFFITLVTDLKRFETLFKPHL